MNGRLKLKRRQDGTTDRRKASRLGWEEQRRRPGVRAFETLHGARETEAAAPDVEPPVPIAEPEPVAEAPVAAPAAEIGPAEAPPSDPKLERLKDAAAKATAPLPEAAKLSAAIGKSLGHAKAASGPEAREALAGVDAEAATVGDAVLIREPEPRLKVLAHEALHVAQRAPADEEAPADPALAAPRSDPEREAAKLEGEVAASALDGSRAAVTPREKLEPEIVARRGMGEPSQDDAAAFREAAAKPSPANDEAGKTSEPEASAAPGGPSAIGAPPAADLTPTNEPDFAPPPAPDVSLSPEAAAKRQAEMDEAKAAMDKAEDVDAAMAGFADAPPSLKARMHGELASRADGLAKSESAEFGNDLPPFEAKMSGDVDVKEPPPLDMSGGQPKEAVGAAPGPTPEPEIAPTAPVVAFEANDEVQSWLAKFFDFDRVKAVGDGIAGVATRDKELDTSPGAPPKVPLEGETDPKQVGEQQAERRGEAVAARDAEIGKVVNGRGPEASAPRALDEAYPTKIEATPELDGAQAVPGADQFVAFGLPPEIEAAVDAKNADAMRASLDGAKAKVDEGVTARDAERDTAVTDTEKKKDDLNRSADAQQAKAVGDARAEIQTARSDTVRDQNKAVADFEAEAEVERGKARTGLDDEVKRGEAEVETEYKAAEKKAEDKEKEAERDAEEKKRQAERDAENESWWDRAKSWVKSAFNALVDAIGKIFDAVRSFVKGVLDAVKSLAKKLIDAVASVIKGLIHAFAELLKGLVTALLGDLFPELAKALNDRIDGAVKAADELIDKAADALKAGVDALIDALGKVLDKIILAFQVVVNASLVLAYGALTGDWSDAARLVLEPLLELLGIDKEQFYAYMGRVSETISMIVDDPGGFIGNLWNAFTTGVGYFRDNFLEHLKNGVIAWLTGAMGGAIQMPKTFDILGVLDVARQVLGLTLDTVRKVAVKVFGERAVEVVEFVVGEVATLIQGGWAALWQRISDGFTGLVDMVLGKLKEFVVTRLIMAAIEKLASLFTPVGALVQLVMTIWNLVMFLKDQFDRIVSVLKSIVDTIVDIAHGVIEPAARGVETALANMLPIAIDLVAKLARLGGVPGKVREIIGGIHEKVEGAIEKLLRKIAAGFKKLFGGGKKGEKPGGEDNPAEAPLVAGAAPDAQIGETLTVEAPGGNHTLFFDVKGADATLMLASTPKPLLQVLFDLDHRIEALPKTNDAEKAKRKSLEADVATAKTMRAALDEDGDKQAAAIDKLKKAAANPDAATKPAPTTAKPAAPKPAAAGAKPAGAAPDDSAIDRKEESLRDVLVRIYQGLGEQATAAVLEKFKAGIEAAHPDARSSIIETLTQNAADLADADWGAAQIMLKAKSTLFSKPLVQAPNNYSRGIRAAIAALVNAATETAFVSVRTDIPAFLERYMRSLHEGDSLYGEALEAVHSALFKNEGYAATAEKLRRTLMLSAEGGAAIDPRLKAIAAGTVAAFLESMAANREYAGIGAADWRELWANPANREHISAAFRRVEAGSHEWILTSFIDKVIQRGRQELSADNDNADPEPAAAAAKWPQLQNKFRSLTTVLIFAKPRNRTLRDFRATKEDGSELHVPVVEVPQGHPGAVQAPVTKDGFAEEYQAQTEFSPGWHDVLTEKFMTHAAEANRIKASSALIEDILKFYKESIWNGEGDFTGSGKGLFNKYASTSGAVGMDGLRANAKASVSNQKTLADALAIFKS